MTHEQKLKFNGGVVTLSKMSVTCIVGLLRFLGVFISFNLNYLRLLFLLLKIHNGKMEPTLEKLSCLATDLMRC